MKNNNKVITILGIIILIIVAIGCTYAYFAAQTGGTTSRNINVTSNTTDNLVFQISNDISFTVTQTDFAENAGNKNGYATATAILTPNNYTGSATNHYYLSFYISNNKTVYSANNTNQDPELMLQVFDSSNQLVTLTGLGTQKTIKGVTGYDITGKEGLITILDNHEIVASNNTAATETWRVVITLINLDVNQNDNTGKTINANILVNKTGFDYCELNPSDCISLTVTNMPETVGKTVTPTCTGVSNGNATWNNKYNQLEVSGITTSKLDCTLTYSNTTGTTPLNTYLIGLSGTAQGEGQMVSENGYRYEGENPNNYVMFNNELWRIIGVFETEYDSDNDGITDTTTNLVKIIRSESIGSLAWDKLNINDWPNSSLYHLLNYEYYDWNTNSGTVDTYCYNYSTTVPITCDYVIAGIQDGYRGMIVKAKWYLGGGGSGGNSVYTTYTPDSIYSYERNENAINTGRSANTLGYVGLIYESDYLYGVLASDCVRTTAHGSYNSASCAGKDWLYIVGWTMSQTSNSPNAVWNMNSSGVLTATTANYGRNIFPVLYLSSSVYKISGTGTMTDPYIIGM